MKTVETFLDNIKSSLLAHEFVKISLGNYTGTSPDLKNIYIKQITVKKVEHLSFTYRYKTRDFVKNYPISEGLEQIKTAIETGFKIVNLFTTTQDFQLEKKSDAIFSIRTTPPTNKEAPSLQHDNEKKRSISSINNTYLQRLKITDKNGVVYAAAQDKYKQINHYIEIIKPLLQQFTQKQEIKVVDMGSGKGYLTFALYDYVVNTLHISSQITGIEYRLDLVNLCNEIANEANFTQLHFEANSIENYICTDIDILIALHACDTATDDAIYKGIQANASLILVAPCCHKQIRREIEKNKPKNELHFLTKYGIFLERHAEMLTDGMRALLLEYAGYKTHIIEFISTTHTPKNVLLVAEKKQISESKKQEILEKYKSMKSYFGVGFHHLEKLLEI